MLSHGKCSISKRRVWSFIFQKSYLVNYLQYLHSAIYINFHLNILAFLGRDYEAEEEAARKKTFVANLKKIEIHNYLHSKGLKSYTLGVNQFADMVNIHYVMF